MHRPTCGDWIIFGPGAIGAYRLVVRDELFGGFDKKPPLIHTTPSGFMKHHSVPLLRGAVRQEGEADASQTRGALSVSEKIRNLLFL